MGIKFSTAALIACFSIALTFARPADAQEPVDVLVVITPGALSGDSVFLALQLQVGMQSVLTNSNMTSRPFRFRPYLLLPTLPGNSPFESIDVHNHIVAGFDPLLDDARDEGGFVASTDATSFDLVVFVVEDLVRQGTTICGAALQIYSNLDGQIPSNNSSENRFAIVISDDPSCTANSARARLISHEIGHIFGGDHQAPRENGDPMDTSPADSDDKNLNYPTGFDHNHPIVKLGFDGDPIYSTVMGGSGYMFTLTQFSSDAPGDTIFANGDDAGNADADMKGMMYAWWDTVAAYRPIPPAPTCSHTNVTTLFCSGNTSTSAITGYINEPYTITNIRLETRLSTSQPWLPGYEGSYTCPAHGSQSTWFFQLLIETAFGTAMCPGQVYVNPWNGCGEEEGGW